MPFLHRAMLLSCDKSYKTILKKDKEVVVLEVTKQDNMIKHSAVLFLFTVKLLHYSLLTNGLKTVVYFIFTTTSDQHTRVCHALLDPNFI